MNEPAQLPRWLKVLRVAFAATLGSALAFSLLMAAWGDLRDGLMLKFVDDRLTRDYVVRAPEGAHLWIGDHYLGQSLLPAISHSEPGMKIRGLSVQVARAYITDEALLKNARPFEPGDSVSAVLQRLAPGATLLHAAQDRLNAGGQFIPLVLARDGRHDITCLCTLDFPTREATTRIAFLLRVEHEGARRIRDGTLECSSVQLSAPGGFWPQRVVHAGLPPTLDGQVGATWRLLLEVDTVTEQSEALAAIGIESPQWVDLVPRK